MQNAKYIHNKMFYYSLLVLGLHVFNKYIKNLVLIFSDVESQNLMPHLESHDFY